MTTRKQVECMITINPKDITTVQMNAYLSGAVTPRPIAFASTIDDQGNVNLSPFSFFNCFGTNPPLLVFSPSRRVRDNTTKHTYENLRKVPEVVINIVNYPMVQQASLASSEYPKGVNEFIKSGFTQVHSMKVKPPRVGESPVSMECKVMQIIETGHEGGAGNLILCEVVLMHIREEILDSSGKIDPFKLDAVARLGGDWYCRVQGESIFKVPKPLDKLGMGIDQIPAPIRYSEILSGNDLGLLGNIEKLPDDTSVAFTRRSHDFIEASRKGIEGIHTLAKDLLAQGKVEEAWKVLLA